MENQTPRSLVQKPAPPWKADALIGEEFKTLSSADFKGKWTCLFFYPLDFTFVCPTEITAFNDAAKRFKELNCEVIGCSVDSKFSHLAWTKTARKEGGLGKLEIPLLADIQKTIGRDYGVLIEEAGITLRGLFLINPEGKVQYQLVHDLGIGRNVDEVVRVLSALQEVAKTGEVCPANWTPGKKTMKPDPVRSKEFFQSNT